ncbi:LacI family DNA-binding transcriptional regulator [Neorhizobium sp. JUb45]|uniref:LacI family DNA-binding transcriptional regulator n=1 Tax=Neorhizobium sp. JUb45 TaxID=2485113 RepID=UPI0010CEC00E|nr:LacI family DNA-binding transcriptional regulator [Neorhizobium sp. JUb45]TCQ97305.1 LacI family transcriptional regulator [Neorhizobium sp. JUb45]
MNQGYPTDKRVTLIDVAKKAGVSRATASLVIRGSPLVSDATRQNVESVIDELGYVRNLTAARLRADQSRIVGVVVPELANPFFAEFLTGIEAVSNDAGLAVLVANSHDDPVRQLDVITRMTEHGVDGLLICPAEGTKVGTLSAKQLLTTPVIQVLRQIRSDLDYVGPDYSGGVEAAIDHLVELGHRHIAFAVYRVHHSAYRDRLDGFRKAMTRHDLDPSLIFEVPHNVLNVPASASAILSLSPEPTAIVCFNDLVALGMSAGLYDLGLAVGHTRALIGFDDVMNTEITRPRLTSVATHPNHVGETAARRLLLRLQDRQAPAGAIITRTNLIVRQSSGLPKL